MAYYDITMDDIARETDCDVTMSNDVAMCRLHIMLSQWCHYEFLLLNIITPNYKIDVSPVSSLTVFIKH